MWNGSQNLESAIDVKLFDWSTRHLAVLGVGYALNTLLIIQTLSLVVLEIPRRKTVWIQEVLGIL